MSTAMLVAHIGGIPVLLIGIIYYALRCASRKTLTKER